MEDIIQEWADSCDVSVYASRDRNLRIMMCVGKNKPPIDLEWIDDSAGVLIDKDYAVAAWRTGNKWNVFYVGEE